MRKVYEVDVNRKVDFSGCKEGLHPFKVITSNSCGYDTEEVVRWCPKCGAVVVDMDFDNRTNPGYYKRIEYPEITLKYGFENYNFRENRVKIKSVKKINGKGLKVCVKK